MNRKFIKKHIILLGILCLLTESCLKEPNYTIVLPTEGDISSGIIPAEISAEFRKVMPIYTGNTPPNIEGEYLCSHMELTGSSLSYDNIGEYYADHYVAFVRQSGSKKVSYYSKQSASHAESEKVTVAGKGNQFTAYFVSEGKSSGIYTKQSVVISGTWAANGIVDYYYAFIMLDKGPDPNSLLVPVHTYRIFKDSDGLAKQYLWRGLPVPPLSGNAAAKDKQCKAKQCLEN